MQGRTGAASVKPQSPASPSFRLILFAALACLTVACGGGGTSAIRTVLLISSDPCRAEHLGCYRDAGAPSATPNIDALARQGVRFEHVLSPIPVTLPAHASMFTGTIPPYHGVHDNGQVLVDDANVTLAEVLKDNGFVTSAVIGALVLSSRFGIDQGFDHYDPRPEPRMDSERILERRGEDVTRLASECLDANHEQPFFLFVHYYDPHTVYDPPAPFGERFADAPYAGEIAYVDQQIGLLVERFEQLELDDSTLVVITADHGEMLGEHGEQTHSYFVYEGAVRVPLIITGPGVEPRVVSDTQAGLVDLLPTIGGLLGIAPPDDIDGVDLSPLLTANDSRTRQGRAPSWPRSSNNAPESSTPAPKRRARRPSSGCAPSDTSTPGAAATTWRSIRPSPTPRTSSASTCSTTRCRCYCGTGATTRHVRAPRSWCGDGPTITAAMSTWASWRWWKTSRPRRSRTSGAPPSCSPRPPASWSSWGRRSSPPGMAMGRSRASGARSSSPST